MIATNFTRTEYELLLKAIEVAAAAGWSHGSRENATYVQKASRKKMAEQVGNFLTRTRRKGESRVNANSLKIKDE